VKARSRGENDSSGAMTLVRGDAVEVLKLHVGLGGNVELTSGAFLGGESVKFCSIWVEPALCEGFEELRFLGSETSEGILKFGGGRRAQIWRT
jgi:hypothetical protein